MFGNYKKIKVDNNELRILINCLNEMRTKMINENRDITVINDLILKYICILEK